MKNNINQIHFPVFLAFGENEQSCGHQHETFDKAVYCADNLSHRTIPYQNVRVEEFKPTGDKETPTISRTAAIYRPMAIQPLEIV